MAQVAHGAYWELLLSPVTLHGKVVLLSPPAPCSGDEELRRFAARTAVMLGRLWRKEELSRILGHCPSSWICPLTAEQPFVMYCCSTCSSESIWLFELREVGSWYTGVSSWVH